MITSALLRVYQDFKWGLERLPASVTTPPSESAVLKHHLKVDSPVIFDVGANLGASVAFYRALYPKSRIYALEPDPDTFAKLKRRHGARANVTLINVGAGDKTERRLLYKNAVSATNSVFELDPESEWLQRTPGMSTLPPADIDLVRLDDLADEQGVTHVDFVKCDTQGFEPEVIKGAHRLLSEKRIGLIKLEVLPGRFYTRTVSLFELQSAMASYGYELVTFGSIVYEADATLRYLDAFFRPSAG
ncbi:MAG: FkbM family methyltransferase [Caulobacteraceae bacterium]